MLDLVTEILRRADANEPLAVCIVAKTHGSTPQKAGATMLVFPSGQTLGTLGGGCVEAEVRVQALKLLQSPQDKLLTFRLDHDDYGWDDGLVCGGTMQIAVQIVTTPDALQPWRDAHQQLTTGHEAVVPFHTLDDSGQPHTFTHKILPQPTLLIAGAGHVGAALANLAPSLGFNVTLIDDRPDYATPARFPHANCIVGPIDTTLAQFPITPHTWIVIVTRGHKHDAQSLAAVIHSNAKYIGLIGSRRKIITIFQSLHQDGIPLESLAKIHAPIGLTLNAITPQEIAISIAAELIAFRRGALDAPIQSMKLPTDLLARTLKISEATPNP